MYKVCLTLFLSLHVCTSLAAEEIDARQAFSLGLTAFKTADYQRALSLFEQALQWGLQDGRVHYNLGMTHYKLGHYIEAEKALKLAARHDQLAAMAYINLGLMAAKQQQRRKAMHYARLAEQRAGTDRQKRLALLLMRKISPVASSINGSIQIHTGFNDNVILLQEDADSGTEQSDLFVMLYSHWQWRMTSKDSLRWSIYNLNHKEIHTHDFSNTTLQYARQWRFVQLYAGVEQSWLEKHAFYDNYDVRLAFTVNPHFDASLSYRRYQDVQKYYDYLLGDRVQAQTAYRWQFGRRYTKVALQWEDNDRENLEREGQRQNFSPSRYQISFSGGWQGKVSKLDLQVGYRDSQYKDEDLLLSGVTGSASVMRRRNDRRWFSQAVYHHALGRRWWFQTQVFVLRNQSNIALHAYNSMQIMLGFTWQCP